MIHLDGIVYALQRYGGISVYFSALAQGLQSKGELISLGLPEGPLPGKPPQLAGGATACQPRRILERYRDYPCDAPIGHSSYFRLPQGAAKSVVTVYDFTYERYFKPHQKLVHGWQKYRAIRKADAVICISESTRRDLFHTLPDVPRSKVHVVHLGVNDAFKPGEATAPAQPFFLYVGARSGYKNFMPVLAALQGRSELLVCVGGGEFTVTEQAAISNYAPGRVSHHAWVDDAALAQLYRQALALVFPSLYEGFGIPVAEAMACGCPVIAANLSSIPEVAGKAGLLLDEVNAFTLRGAFEQVLQPGQRAERTQAGLEQARQFSWSACVEKTQTIYNSLYPQVQP